jgi:drug/metabolite transporter (DMT)-like permease
MESPVLFAWIASITYGIEAITSKLASKHVIQNPWLFNFLWTLFILIFTIPIALWNGVGLPPSWGNIIISGFFYGIGSALYVLALYKLDVTVIAPLFSIRTAMAVLAGTIFLGEILTATQYLLTAAIAVFGVFVSMDERFSLRSFFNRNTFIALLAMLTLVAWSAFFKQAVAETSYWDATLWVAIVAQIWLIPTIPLFVKGTQIVTSKQYSVLAGIAVFGTIGTLAVNKAFAISVSITSTIISIPVSMAIAFLFSVFAPQLLEKHTLKVYAVRFISAAIMIVAASQL